MSAPKIANLQVPGFPDRLPRIGRMDHSKDSVRQWAFEARALWGVPIRVYERTLSAGGVNARVWLAVVWPKGSGAER